GLWINADAACQGIAVEGGARALLAEIPRDGRGQFLDRYRGAPQPKARRGRGQGGGNEEGRLQAVGRGRRPSKRAHHIGESIERKAPDHTVGERWEIESDERLRAQQRDSRWALGEQALTDDAGVRQARQQQRVGPG